MASPVPAASLAVRFRGLLWRRRRLLAALYFLVLLLLGGGLWAYVAWVPDRLDTGITVAIRAWFYRRTFAVVESARADLELGGASADAAIARLERYLADHANVQQGQLWSQAVTEAGVLLADHLTARNRGKRAAEVLDPLLLRLPLDYRLWWAQGRALAATGETQAALVPLATAFRLTLHHPGVAADYLAALDQLGRYAEIALVADEFDRAVARAAPHATLELGVPRPPLEQRVLDAVGIPVEHGRYLSRDERLGMPRGKGCELAVPAAMLAACDAGGADELVVQLRLDNLWNGFTIDAIELTREDGRRETIAPRVATLHREGSGVGSVCEAFVGVPIRDVREFTLVYSCATPALGAESGAIVERARRNVAVLGRAEMRRTPHLLRDAVLLTLPVLFVVIWLWISALGSFWNAEVRNFHGELIRDLRVGTLRMMVRAAIRNVFAPRERRYLPLKRPGASLALAPADAAPAEEIVVYDLRMRGEAIDALAADLPESARSRQEAMLAVGGAAAQEVEANWRGQRMENYFFPQKSWKLRTKRDELVDRQRLLNLTPIKDRMASFSTFTLARACGLPAPLTKFVHLYVNLEDKGIYLQEEQLDESFLRRIGLPPSDVFYGELFVPDVPANSSWELFWNPYLWEKHDRWERYADEWRPWLGELLDATADRSLAGLDRLQECLDESFALYYAVLCYEGDQHVDASHNVRLALDRTSGRLVGLLWNPLSNMPDGQGVETIANPLFRRLAEDPRFLDRVARFVSERMAATPQPQLQLAALDRLERGLAEAGVAQEPANLYSVRSTRRRLLARHATVRKQHEVAELAFEQVDVTPASKRLTLHATCVASLLLRALELDPASEPGRSGELELFEDRDFDGLPGPGDWPVAAHLEGHRLVIDTPEELLPVGRDFTAAYQQTEAEADDAFEQHREFTRLAALATPFLLRAGAGAVPRVVGIEAARSVGAGAVAVREGAPQGLLATATIHPWRIPAPAPPRRIDYSGVVELRESLAIGARDRLEVAPGTQLLLAPGVSIQLGSAVQWRDVAIRRLDPARPFGVIALQGHGCDGSTFVHVTIEGGSEATIGWIHYSGMFSAHQVDRLVIRDSRFAANLLGDDAVHLGACRDLVIERTRVEQANADAIDFAACAGVLRDSAILAAGDDGIDMTNSRVDVERVEVAGAGGRGLSIGDSSPPGVIGCTLRDCATGIAIEESSEPVIRETRIEGCRTGLFADDENARRRDGSLGRLERCTFARNGADLSVGKSPLVSFERCETDQEEKLP